MLTKLDFQVVKAGLTCRQGQGEPFLNPISIMGGWRKKTLGGKKMKKTEERGMKDNGSQERWRKAKRGKDASWVNKGCFLNWMASLATHRPSACLLQYPWPCHPGATWLVTFNPGFAIFDCSPVKLRLVADCCEIPASSWPVAESCAPLTSSPPCCAIWAVFLQSLLAALFFGFSPFCNLWLLAISGFRRKYIMSRREGQVVNWPAIIMKKKNDRWSLKEAN